MSEPLSLTCPHCGAPLTIERAAQVSRDGNRVTVALPSHADPEDREPVYSTGPNMSAVVSRFRLRCIASGGEADVRL